MGISAEDVTSVLREVAPALKDGWIQKVYQPGSRTLVLEIRTPGQTRLLLLSADPETARLHLSTLKLPNPPAPPAFCQFLRARIQGAHVDALEQAGDDRIVRLRLTTRDGPASLIGALTGRQATVLVVDGQDRILLGLDPDRAKPGEPYRPPAAHPRSAAATVAASTATAASDQPFPLSAALEARYADLERQRAEDRGRDRRLNEVKKAIKKSARRIDALKADLEKAGKYRDYARYGELLKANLGQLHKGEEQATVVDYFDPALPSLTLPLDPSKGPQANMDDYFKKHRKFLAAEREIAPRIATIEQELAALRAEKTAIEQGTWAPPTKPAHPAPTGLGRSRSAVVSPTATSPSAQRKGPYRRFTSADGLAIYVGKNARENDDLTFKFAHPDDLWLHAHGMPGSHVVVRVDKGADLPHETLKDAATLALLYSDLKKSGKGEVIYTRRKWVRKAKGQSPGSVTATQEKAIFVQLDKARLARLKEGAG